MNYKEAIETIMSNYPPPQYTMLRDALELSIRVLEEKIKEEESTVVVDVDFEEVKEENENEL